MYSYTIFVTTSLKTSTVVVLMYTLCVVANTTYNSIASSLMLETYFNTLEYWPVLFLAMLGIPSVIALLLAFLYIQCFQGVLLPSSYSTVHRILVAVSVVIGLGLVATLVMEQVYMDMVFKEGIEAFRENFKYSDFANEYLVCYRVLCLLSVVQLLIVVVTLKTKVSKQRRVVSDMSGIGNGTTKKRRATKLDILHWVYGAYCVSYLFVTVLMSLAAASFGSATLYNYCLVPSVLIEGICLAVIVYTPGNKGGARKERERERETASHQQWQETDYEETPNPLYHP
ncbi:hypothetical protein KIPB_010253 [Kipferlia bialata]|uniref:Uncharacterized protein n=1 Tax=Kipferlia bialata TaxID=797122 RepID=A0A9K3D2T5_9EUKA|nr:hypothetical protein KIPB_010253 [Kipferlia bialata]|eukprot:g10253.t1